MNNPKNTLAELAAKAVEYAACAPHINEKLGPGKFIEKFATQEQKDTLSGLRSEDMPQPMKYMTIYGKDFRCSVCWDSLRGQHGKCVGDRRCPLHGDFTPTNRKTIFKVSV